MEPVQIADKIKERFPDAVLNIAEFGGQVSISIKREAVLDMCRWLHDEPDLSFDHLMDLCGVDWLGKRADRFDVVYNLYSINHGHMMRLKVPLSEDDPTVTSVVPVWRGADWHERECYDMFGIVFDAHPDLRRILMPEDWKGWPLRKDYPLGGVSFDDDWEDFKECVRKKDRLKEFEWNNR